MKKEKNRFRLGLYGHSVCTASTKRDGSYQQILVNKFPTLDIVNIGAGQSSQERIFYELKKTKNLDAAIIFHSRPGSIFIPGSNQDLATATNTIDNKIKRAWDYSNNDLEELHWECDPNNSRGLSRVFPNLEEFQQTINLYLKYLYTPDLEKNRFEGALLAVDRYCASNKIKHVVHVPSQYIPPWFSFQSGTMDQELVKLSTMQGVPSNPNCLQDGVNELMANKISDLLSQYIHEKE